MLNCVSNIFKGFSCVLAVIVLSCSTNDSVQGAANVGGSEVNVLFIGNSHTYFNYGIPQHVEGFGISLDKSINAEMSANGGYTLEDHLNHHATSFLIGSTDWDYIILQENSYRAAYEPELMISSITELQTLLNSTNAEILLFMTWNYQHIPEMLPLLNEAYNEAKMLTGYTLVPIGNYWQEYSSSGTLNLYEADGIHPNIIGTYLTSAIFYGTMFSNEFLLESDYDSMLTEQQANEIKLYVEGLNLHSN